MGTVILVTIVSFVFGVLLISLVVAGREGEEWPERVEQARGNPAWHEVLRWARQHTEGRDPARAVTLASPAAERRTGVPWTIGRGKLGMRPSMW
jgi:hypothetical protein